MSLLLLILQPTMFTLDNTTLFYFSLSDALPAEKQHTHAIQDWVKTVPKTAGSTLSSRRNVKSALSRTRSTAHPSSSSRSALNSGFVRQSGGKEVEVMEIDSPLSDNDETKGPEREAAIKSPLKGKRRLSSLVSKNHHGSYFLLYSYVPRLSLNLKLPPKRLCVRVPARDQKMMDCPKSGWTAMLGAS